MDKTAVRVMWARESMEDRADEILTHVDDRLNETLIKYSGVSRFVYTKYLLVCSSVHWIKLQYHETYDILITPINAQASTDDDLVRNMFSKKF